MFKNDLATSAQPAWHTPLEFKTEGEYQIYFQSLPFETQLAIAESGIAQAQRYVAGYYQKLKEYEKSGPWWEKACANNDPVALLHEGDLRLRLDALDESLKYYNRAQDAVQKSKDNEFKDCILKEVETSKIKLSVAYSANGIDLFPTNEAAAKVCFEKSLTLCDHPASAYNLGLIQMNTKNYKTAAYNFRLALHFSAKSETPNELRALCHYYLGRAKLITLGNNETASYKTLLSIATHLHKAVTYGDKPMFVEEFNNFLDSIKDEEVKLSLQKDSTPLQLKSGIFKGAQELFSSNLNEATAQEKEDWKQYPDPRKAEAKNSIGKQPNMFNKNNHDGNNATVKNHENNNNNASNPSKPAP